MSDMAEPGAAIRFAGIAQALQRALDAAAARLEAIDEAASGAVRAGGRWSRKEILGHLADSAANNHQRFVRAQLEESLTFPGYAQDEWVAVQDYSGRTWAEVLTLWQSLNRHLVHVLGRIPDSAAARACRIGGGAPVTLVFVAEDYVRHLQHHLEQILDPEEAGGSVHAPFQGRR